MTVPVEAVAGAIPTGGPEWSAIVSIALSILAAAVATWRELANRRKLKAEARTLDLKTPAEVDNLNATTHTAEFTRVLEFNKQVLENNADLVRRNDDLTGKLETMSAKQDEILENQRKQDVHASRLELWLEQAYAYIEDLLAWVERHVPGAVPPIPPRNYRPKFTRENMSTES